MVLNHFFRNLLAAYACAASGCDAGNPGRNQRP